MSFSLVVCLYGKRTSPYARNGPEMAQRTVVQLVDDIDGTQITDNQGETVTFGLDGATYEIDLTHENAQQLRNAVQVYIANARRVSGGRGRPAAPANVPTQRRGGASSGKRDPEQTKAIKEWARANGHKVAERGRISQSVIEAYEAAH
jgi:Lsr2